MKTALQVALDHLKWNGGTIHQVKGEFLNMSQMERDRLVIKFIDNMSSISDLRTVQWFTSQNAGL